MAYRYIALMDTTGRPQNEAGIATAQRLHSLNMRQCLQTRCCTVYVSRDTPTVPLQKHGLLIGHVFSSNGVPITHEEQLPLLQDSTRLRRHILENCWGAYLLIQVDTEQRACVTLFRDPEGGMPGIHHLDNGIGFIASDIQIPIHMGLYHRKVDWDSIRHRLIYPDIKTTLTGLLDVQELLPGTCLSIRDQGTAINAEWSPWNFAAPGLRYSCLEDAARAVRTTLDMVVKAWANVDKSILLELSGGLDSSLVGASLKGSSAQISCCTLVTPVPGADERRYASQIASLLNAHMEAAVMDLESPRYDFVPAPGLATPRVGMLQHVTDTIMESALLRHGANSFFSGGGGDTVFCYLTSAAPAADAFREAGPIRGLRSIRELAVLHQCTIWKAGRLTLRKLMQPPKSPFHAQLDFIEPAHASCVPEHHPWFDAADTALSGDRERIFALATAQVYRDSAPRGRRAHLRLPLLSQPMMETTLRIPSWMWVSGGQNRSVARQAFADVLPPEIFMRRSKGSFIGYVGSLYARNRVRLRDYLLEGTLRSHGILDAQALQRYTDHKLLPRDRSFGRILDLCAVENWIRHQL